MGKKQRKKRESLYSDDSNFDEENFSEADSEDSNSKFVKMETICKELDAAQISKVFIMLLSKDYVNSNAAEECRL